jgi:hypothetical protein
MDQPFFNTYILKFVHIHDAVFLQEEGGLFSEKK